MSKTRNRYLTAALRAYYNPENEKIRVLDTVASSHKEISIDDAWALIDSLSDAIGRSQEHEQRKNNTR